MAHDDFDLSVETSSSGDEEGHLQSDAYSATGSPSSVSQPTFQPRSVPVSSSSSSSSLSSSFTSTNPVDEDDKGNKLKVQALDGAYWKRIKKGCHSFFHPKGGWMWRRLWKSRLAYAVILLLAIVCCVSLTLIIFALEKESNDDQTDTLFSRSSTNIVTAIESQMSFLANDLLQSSAAVMKTLFPARNDSFTEVYEFMEATTDHHRKIVQATGWDPLVRPNQLESLQNRIRVSDPRMATFNLTEVKPAEEGGGVGNILPLTGPPRSEYMPIAFMQPIEGNEKAIGFDLMSNPVRRVSIVESINTGDVVMTGRIVLVQADTTSYGALLIQAIYEDGTTNLPKGGGDMGKNVAGAVSMAIDFDSSIDGALSQLEDEALRVAVHDITDVREVLYDNRRKNESPDNYPRQQKSRITIMTRHWELSVFATNKFEDDNDEGKENSELVAGFIITALVFLFLCALFFFMDRSKRTAAMNNELALRYHRAQVEAVAAAQVKEDFLSNMSHELRTPINGVIGIADIIMESDENTAFPVEMVALKGCCDALQAMINDILDFSKMKSGQLSIEYGQFVIDSAFRASLSVVSSKVGDKKIRLTYILDPGVPKSVVADLVRVRQVVLNLLSNAVKFTNESGTIVVSVSSQPRAPKTGVGVSSNGDKNSFVVDMAGEREGGTTHTGSRAAGRRTDSVVPPSKLPLHSWWRDTKNRRQRKRQERKEKQASALENFNSLEDDNPSVDQIYHSYFGSEGEAGGVAEVFSHSGVGRRARMNGARGLKPDESIMFVESLEKEGTATVVIKGKENANIPSDLDTEIFVSVKDSGLGIPPDKLAMIFDEFSQADSTTTRVHGGTGLGLSICKRLVQLMGGSITLESTVGEGSTFTFSFLCRNADDDNVQAEFQYEDEGSGYAGRGGSSDVNLGNGVWRSEVDSVGNTVQVMKLLESGSTKRSKTLPDSSEGRGVAVQASTDSSPGSPGRTTPPPESGYSNRPAARSVLFVDDVDLNVRIGMRLFTSLGCTVLSADSGQLALEMTKAEKFDLIVVDVNMPGMSGMDVSREIRGDQLNPNRDVPIIACTANDHAHTRQACSDSGMNDFITKPVRRARVADVLGRWLPGDNSSLP